MDDAPQIDEEKESYLGAYVLASVLVLVFIGWFVWSAVEEQFFTTGSSDDIIQELPQEEIVYIDDPASLGTLYLSLARPSSPYPMPYAYDITTRSLQALRDPEVLSLYNDFSSDGLLHAFVGTTFDNYLRSGGHYDDSLQVYIAPTDVTHVYPSDSAVTQLTNTDTPFKRELSVRRDGVVLYSTRPDVPKGTADHENNQGDFAAAAEWSIFVAKQGEESVFVTKGVHPKWIDDLRFLYVGERGLYIYDFEKGRSTRFIETVGRVYSNVKMDLSDDGRIIAWSNPDDGEVLLFEVADWDVAAPSATPIGRIPVHAFWVMIAPDNSAIAVQAVDWESLDTAPNPRIEMYALPTLQKSASDYSLAQFDQKRMFLTDWR